eukprot:scaffold10715_cov114-Isochrysis_galbana.AAC.26
MALEAMRCSACSASWYSAAPQLDRSLASASRSDMPTSGAGEAPRHGRPGAAAPRGRQPPARQPPLVRFGLAPWPRPPQPPARPRPPPRLPPAALGAQPHQPPAAVSAGTPAAARAPPHALWRSCSVRPSPARAPPSLARTPCGLGPSLLSASRRHPRAAQWPRSLSKRRQASPAARRGRSWTASPTHDRAASQFVRCVPAAP